MNITVYFVAAVCPFAPHVAHSTNIVHGYEYGDTLDYTCDTGYSLNPNASIIDPPEEYITEQTTICKADGLWDTIQDCLSESLSFFCFNRYSKCSVCLFRSKSLLTSFSAKKLL